MFVHSIFAVMNNGFVLGGRLIMGSSLNVGLKSGSDAYCMDFAFEVGNPTCFSVSVFLCRVRAHFLFIEVLENR
jgi:hypothetical protein